MSDYTYPMDGNLKNTDIERIAKKGQKIYEKIKDDFQPKYDGEFLAIDVDSGDFFKAKSTSEAVQQAKEKYPDKIFYVVKIGFSATEILSRLELQGV